MAEFVIALMFLAIVLTYAGIGIRQLYTNPHRSHGVKSGDFLNLNEPDCGDSAAAMNRTTVVNE